VFGFSKSARGKTIVGSPVARTSAGQHRLLRPLFSAQTEKPGSRTGVTVRLRITGLIVASLEDFLFVSFDSIAGHGNCSMWLPEMKQGRSMSFEGNLMT
jgi:hypothetical protein